MLGPIGGAAGLMVGIGQLMLGEGFRQGSLSVRHAGVIVAPSETLPPGRIVDGVEYPTGVITAPRLVQAMASGAEEIPMDIGHWSERHAYVRLPEDYPGQAEDAAAVARLMVYERVPYSFASYAYLAAWKVTGREDGRLARWINRRRPAMIEWPSHGTTSRHAIQIPREAICSVLAEQSWTLTGKRVVEGTRPQAVTPGMLADALSSYEGATWCRPRPARGGARSWTV